MSEDNAGTRRNFLKRLIARADVNRKPSAPMRYPQSATDLAHGRRTVPVLRPPGAVEETAFLAGCTRCGDCATACPHDALHPASERLRAAAGAPTFDPLRGPCLMCEDTPCIAACEPGVLSQEYGVRMGTARIDPQVCLAFQGSGCSACVERCPVPEAIDVDEQMRPRIVQDVCTGCGVCQYVCPAPHNAVGIMPTFVRPDA